MITPEIRRGWWHLSKDGDWRECSMCCPMCVGGNISDVATISGYGSRLSKDDPWVIHASRIEAERFLDRLIFRHAISMAATVPEAIEYANTMLNNIVEKEQQ